jgi:hypothetical protein
LGTSNCSAVASYMITVTSKNSLHHYDFLVSLQLRSRRAIALAMMRITILFCFNSPKPINKACAGDEKCWGLFLSLFYLGCPVSVKLCPEIRNNFGVLAGDVVFLVWIDMQVIQHRLRGFERSPEFRDLIFV